MDGLEPIGRALVIIGVFITVLGAVMLLTPRARATGPVGMPPPTNVTDICGL